MDKKIIVIGAGASGVAATTKLLSNGFKNITILEAENRIGGRLRRSMVLSKADIILSSYIDTYLLFPGAWVKKGMLFTN